VAEEPVRDVRGGFPSNMDGARFLAKKALRSARLRWTAWGKEYRWVTGIRRNVGDSIGDTGAQRMGGFVNVPLPPHVEGMADPFLWTSEGRDYLFFEEIRTSASRGRIGCIEVEAEGRVSAMQIVLDRPYHLSYPCVVPWRGDLFLLPETSEANRVDLYRFKRFPTEVELVASLMEGAALVDTTPVCVEGRWYFFTTTAGPYMETILFTADRLDGPWTLHPASPVSRSVRSSRSAGSLLWKNGRLLRPTQDCSVCYGHAIDVKEVVQLTPNEYKERTVAWVPPVWCKGLVAAHTWNESAKYQVTDGLRWVKKRLLLHRN